MKVSVDVDFRCPRCKSTILNPLTEVWSLFECQECLKVFPDSKLKVKK